MIRTSICRKMGSRPIAAASRARSSQSQSSSRMIMAAIKTNGAASAFFSSFVLEPRLGTAFIPPQRQAYPDSPVRRKESPRLLGLPILSAASSGRCGLLGSNASIRFGSDSSKQPSNTHNNQNKGKSLKRHLQLQNQSEGTYAHSTTPDADQTTDLENTNRRGPFSTL